MTSGLQSTSAGTTASLLRAADENVGVTAALLKKTMSADKNMVETLLPTPPSAGKVDIRA